MYMCVLYNIVLIILNIFNINIIGVSTIRKSSENMKFTNGLVISNTPMQSRIKEVKKLWKQKHCFCKTIETKKYKGIRVASIGDYILAVLSRLTITESFAHIFNASIYNIIGKIDEIKENGSLVSLSNIFATIHADAWTNSIEWFRNKEWCTISIRIGGFNAFSERLNLSCVVANINCSEGDQIVKDIINECVRELNGLKDKEICATFQSHIYKLKWTKPRIYISSMFHYIYLIVFVFLISILMIMF